MRSTWHSSSSSSPREEQRPTLKSTPRSTRTFTHTLTRTWTGKCISINTFIFSVSHISPTDCSGTSEGQSALDFVAAPERHYSSGTLLIAEEWTWRKTAVASNTHLVFLHPNFHIWCVFLYLPHTTKIH